MKRGFTLAEVLITLAIIGVVAALSIPSVVKNYQETQFKTAYKKAFSDLNRVFAQTIAFNEFPERKNDCYDVNFANFVYDTIKENFKSIKECSAQDLYNCWAKGDTLGESESPVEGSSKSFVDASGRVWTEYHRNRAIWMVDTNGTKSPNKFSKDRWTFTFFNKDSNTDCTITTSKPIQIKPYPFSDYTTESDSCHYPPCYYKSWLTK
jgi:prepilin-type N-terminal cleavage/methylation domain-containing protein